MLDKPLDASAKLAEKRAAKAYVGSSELGDWEYNTKQVESGKAEMAVAAAAISAEVANDAGGPVLILMDFALVYHLGAMYHGWENTHYPDQVYTYRHPSQDPINWNYNSGGNDPNNPNFDPRTAVGIFGVSIVVLDQLKAWDEYFIKAKKSFIVQPSSTNVNIPIPTTIGPK